MRSLFILGLIVITLTFMLLAGPFLRYIDRTPEPAYAQTPVKLEVPCDACKDQRVEYIRLGRLRDQCISEGCASFHQVDSDYAAAVQSLKDCRLNKCSYGWYQYSILDSPSWDDLEYGTGQLPSPTAVSSPMPTLVSDADGDGVHDMDDMCPYTPIDTPVTKDGCPDCGSNQIYDPASPYAHPQTGCSPKVAYIFTTEDDPTLDWRHKLLMRPRYNHVKNYYEKLGYKVEFVKLTGTVEEIRTYHTVDINSQGESHTIAATTKVWTADKNRLAEYLAKPSTKAIAYFGHGGKLVAERPFWWDNYKPSLGGHTESDLFGTVRNQSLSYYQKQYKLEYDEANRKAVQKTSNLGLDYAYIYSCHSLDDTSMRDFLLRSGGIYWGEQGVLTGAMPLEKSVKP